VAEREERKVGGRILDWRELDRQPSEFGTWNEPNSLLRVAAHLLGFQGAHSVALRATADGRLEAALSALYNGSPVRLVATSGGLLRVQVEGSEVTALGSEGAPLKQGGDGRLFLDIAEINSGPLPAGITGVMPTLPLWACRDPDARTESSLGAQSQYDWDLGSAASRVVIATCSNYYDSQLPAVAIYDEDSAGGNDRPVATLTAGNAFVWLNSGQYIGFYNVNTSYDAYLVALAFNV